MERTYPAHVLQTDPVMDLALFKVDADRTLAAVQIGTSSDLMVGETVITIGNAFGYENTVSVGIISALHRDVTLSDEQVYRNLIQTDACINPGNSGGPLINVNGELIGINVAVRAGAQGIGFALPIDEVKRVATDDAEHSPAGFELARAGQQRTAAGIQARRCGQRGAAGEPRGSLRVQAGRRAGPDRRPGDRQSPGCRARHARRPSRPSRDRDDPSRQEREGDPS